MDNQIELMNDTLGRFQAAISLVVVCQRCLESKALAEAGDEETVLQEAIKQLRKVYNEFDGLNR